MTEKQYQKTTAGHPIIFRVASHRNKPGTAADCDIVIADRIAQREYPADPRYGLFYQRLDDGRTYSGIYHDSLPNLIDKALRLTAHEDLSLSYTFLLRNKGLPVG